MGLYVTEAGEVQPLLLHPARTLLVPYPIQQDPSSTAVPKPLQFGSTHLTSHEVQCGATQSWSTLCSPAANTYLISLTMQQGGSGGEQMS